MPESLEDTAGRFMLNRECKRIIKETAFLTIEDPCSLLQGSSIVASDAEADHLAAQGVLVDAELAGGRDRFAPVALQGLEDG
jgi:hypothetical protein